MPDTQKVINYVLLVVMCSALTAAALWLKAQPWVGIVFSLPLIYGVNMLIALRMEGSRARHIFAKLANLFLPLGAWFIYYNGIEGMFGDGKVASFQSAFGVGLVALGIVCLLLVSVLQGTENWDDPNSTIY